MKIRLGFVSNSSSTSFTLLVKENSVGAVYSAMRKYHQYFELYGDWGSQNEKTRYCDVEEIISEMSLVKPKLIPIKNLVSQLEALVENAVMGQKTYPDDYISRYIQHMEERLIDLTCWIGKGFTHALVIGFGDNDGEVSGTKVAYLMDYEGRYIHIDKPDLVVSTEQNR